MEGEKKRKKERMESHDSTEERRKNR